MKKKNHARAAGKKGFSIALPITLIDDIQRIAEQETRSRNGQIEKFLTDSVKIYKKENRKEIEPALSNVTPISRKLTPFRFVGAVAAGEPVEAPLEESIETVTDLDPSSHIVVEINGQSAEPHFIDGDRWIVCTKNKGFTAAKGKPAIFRDSSGSYLKIYEGGKVPFRSVNPDFPDVYPGESLELVGYPVERVEQPN